MARVGTTYLPSYNCQRSSMALTITDDQLHSMGMDERAARIEIACRLFDAGRLDLWPAAQLAGLDRVEFENELHTRHIPIYRPTADDLDRELEAMTRLGV